MRDFIPALILAVCLTAGCDKQSSEPPFAMNIHVPELEIKLSEISNTAQTNYSTNVMEMYETKKDYVQIGFILMRNENADRLRLGMTEREVIDALGEPEVREKPRIWMSDAVEHIYWRYPSKGIDINFVSNTVGRKVYLFRLQSPCGFQTRKGIHIGSSRNEAIKAYRNEIEDTNGTPETLVAGTLYGGVILSFTNGLVNEIFIGPAEE